MGFCCCLIILERCNPWPPVDVAPTAEAKPACIEPATGNRLADSMCRPCPDHAQPAANKVRTSVTNTFLNSLVVLIVV